MGHAARLLMPRLSPLILLIGALGAGLVLFAAASQAGHEPVGQALVYVIGAAFLGGVVELWLRARAAERLSGEVASLSGAMSEAALLEALAQSGSPTVREADAAWRAGRISGPPAAGFTPYLVSLVVMVGLLGTFLGFVDTLAGARAAIAGSPDLDTLKSGLAQPLAGLGRAFGVSLAGVGASAALGAAAAVARRIELRAHGSLRRLLTTRLAAQGPTARQLVALEALSAQADALPAAAAALERAVTRLDAVGPALDAAQDRSAQRVAATLETTLRGLQSEIGQGFERSTASAHEAMLSLGGVAAERLAEAGAAAFERWATAQAEVTRARHAWEQAEGERLGAALEAVAERAGEHELSRAARLEAHVEAVVGRLEVAQIGAQQADVARLAAFEAQVGAVVGRLEVAQVAAQQADAARLAAFEARLSSVVSEVQRALDGVAETQAAQATRQAVEDERRTALLLDAQRATQASGETLAALVEATRASAAQAVNALPAQLDRLGVALEQVERAAAARLHDAAVVEAERLDRATARVEARLDVATEAVADRAASLQSDLASSVAAAEVHARSLRATLAEVELAAAQRLDAAQADAAARLSTTVQALSTELVAQFDRFIEAQSARAGEAATVIARLDASLSEHLTALGAGLAEPLRAVVVAAHEAPAAAARMVEAAAARATAAHDAEAAHLERVQANEAARVTQTHALLERLAGLEARVESAVDAQAERLAAFEARLITERGASAEALARSLVDHATSLGAGLDGTGVLVREAAELVKSGGAELSAVAGLFADSVDRYREANEHWRRTLVGLEEALQRGGGGEGGETGQLLGHYLDQTREIFGDTLRFQRELFSELRALRGGPPA
jgi:hypothetical protein